VLRVATLAAVAAVVAAHSPSPIRVVRLRFVDHTRVAHLHTGKTVPRTLVTEVRYPASGGPFPLVVFGHGFALTPDRYAALLDAWARAGYVVAAPLFPVENANAPGGPSESDLVNQPGDIRFVITQLLADRALRGLIDPQKIAVAGQSDGAETAYAVAYESRYRDPRIRAAVVLSGAELPGGTPGPGPPLLAAQGTRDAINSPSNTAQLYRDTGRPKFLLWLLGASHLPPYTTNVRERTVVERVTIAFLDRYLKHGSLSGLLAAGRAPGVARLTAQP